MWFGTHGFKKKISILEHIFFRSSSVFHVTVNHCSCFLIVFYFLGNFGVLNKKKKRMINSMIANYIKIFAPPTQHGGHLSL